MKNNKFITPALFLQCLLSATLLAQSPMPKQWDYRFGGTDYEEFSSLQQTTDGGYILGGHSYSDSSGDKTEDNWGFSDYWVIKIDANGVKQWDKRFGGVKDEVLNSLQQTTDGGYIFGGWSRSDSSGDKTEDSQGNADYWIIKTDANGIKQWDKQFGGSDGDFLTSLQQTTDGGYILGGYSFSGISGDKTEASWGDVDYWIVKIDANGTKQWDSDFGGLFYEYLTSIKQTTEGGYILGGFIKSNGGDITEDTRGEWDYWIVKIDANGTKQWDKRFGGNNYDELTSLQQTTDGGYILGGYSTSDIGGDVTEPNRGISDYWVIKTDENGNKQWDKRFGGTSSDKLSSLQQTTDGGYILGGTSFSDMNGDKSEETRGHDDYWIVKIDVNGLKEWDARFGGSDYDIFRSLQQTAEGGFILGGFSWSHRSGDKTQNYRANTYDYWVVKVGCPPSAKMAARGDRDLCPTDSVMLIADASAGVKFQWLKEGIKIEGATKRTYTATETGRYRVVVYTSSECSQISEVITVINSCRIARNKISISPNPSHGIVTLTYNSSTAGNVQLNVYDKTGKRMFSKTEYTIKGSNTYKLNLSGLLSGIYHLELKSDSQSKIVSFVIEK